FFAEIGTHVMHKGEELYINKLDTKAAHNFIRIGRDIPGVQIVLCCKDTAYVETRDPESISEIKKYYERLEYIEDLTSIKNDVLKVNICYDRGVETNDYSPFKDYEPCYTVQHAASVLHDITTNATNKEYEIRQVQKSLGMDTCEIIVFGDYLNDVEMKPNAENSYAMK